MIAHTITANTQWEARIGAALSRDGVTYVRVLKEHLVGTWLCVYAKQSLVPLITDARAGTVSSGMLGVMGNKVIKVLYTTCFYTLFKKRATHDARAVRSALSMHAHTCKPSRDLPYSQLLARVIVSMHVLQLDTSHRNIQIQHCVHRNIQIQHRVRSEYCYGYIVAMLLHRHYFNQFRYCNCCPMHKQGAVSIRLCIRDSSLCFVCAHLAAHRENVAARNDNYHKVGTSALCT
jgi:hypothetical protein